MARMKSRASAVVPFFVLLPFWVVQAFLLDYLHTHSPASFAALSRTLEEVRLGLSGVPMAAHFFPGGGLGHHPPKMGGM